MTVKKKSRPFYSEEFKAQAVVKSQEIGISATRRLDTYEELKRENRKLKQEMGYIYDINKILNKRCNFLKQKIVRFSVIRGIHQEKKSFPWVSYVEILV